MGVLRAAAGKALPEAEQALIILSGIAEHHGADMLDQDRSPRLLIHSDDDLLALFDGALALLKLVLAVAAVGWALASGWPGLQGLGGDGGDRGHRPARSRKARPSFLATCSALRMRCTQKVHFSITPLERTVTSGLSCMLSGAGNAGSAQLKTRTLYGQLLEQ